MPTWLFEVPTPYRAYGRWWFAVEGADRRCYGPYPSERSALDAREALFHRWRVRAEHLRGDLLRLTAARWIVTLPSGVPCAGQPFRGRAIAVHTSGPPEPPKPMMQSDSKP